jgi:hypothetical protein
VARSGRTGSTGRSGRGRRPKLPPRLRLVLYVAGAIAVMMFAVQGGEYGTSDLLRQRAQQRLMKSEIESLRVVVDSLSSYKARLETDSAVQERIAREEFGMVRGSSELLYRFADPPSAPEVAEPRARP